MGFRWSLLNRLRESYALKLAVALVSIVALTIAVGALVQAQTADQLREDVQGELTTISESQAGTLETWLSNVNRQTRTLSEHPTVSAGDTYRKQALLRDRIADDGVPEGVVAVHYYDADERTIVTSSADEFVGINPAQQNAPFATDPPTFDGADDVYVSDPFRTSITDFPVVAVMSPVPDDPGKRIIFMVNIEERTQALTGTVEGGSTVVLDSDGRYIVHPDTDKLLTSHHGGASSPVVEQGLAGKSGFIEGETDDETDDPTLLAYAPIDSADWVVAVRVPESEAYALGATVTSNIVGLILIAVVSLGLVGVTVGSNTVISLRQLSGKARAMEDGDLGVDLGTNRRDEFGTLYDSFARMRDSLRDQIREAETVREEAETAREEAEQARENAEQARERTEDARKAAETQREEAQALSSHLETKASHYEEVMNAAADGDLRVRVDTESRSEAMVAIGESLNDMLVDIERTVASVKRFSSHVSNAVVDVERSAEDVMATGEEVSESVSEISDGATDQTEHLGEVADRMNALSASAQQVAATVDDVAATSEQAAAAGELGRDAAEDALAEMDAVETATERTVAEIEELDEEMAAIGDIVEVITEIADRTNMVAINASIEAARSGENGEGFAVVAEEVKSLAEKTKESATEIEGRIERIQSKTSQSVEGMAETSERVAAGIETVDGAIDALEEIAAYVEETDESIHEIRDATDSQAESSSAVVAMVDDVAAISEETATQAEGVADAAEDQTRTLTSVSRDAEDLAGRAVELSQLLDDFQVADDAGETDGTEFEFAEVKEA